MTAAYAMLDEKGEVVPESICGTLDDALVHNFSCDESKIVPVFVGRWMDIESAPRVGEFLAPHPSGELRQCEWYNNPFEDYKGKSVIHRATGKWWVTDRWTPLPPAPAGEG